MPTPRRKRPFVELHRGRWRARWPDADGVLRSSSFDKEGQPFEDDAAAEQFAWEQMGEISRGTWLDPRRSGITLTDWVNQWWVINRIEELEEGSWQRYRNDIQAHFLPAFGHLRLAELADADVALAAWQTQHRREYAKNTASNRRDLFSTILNDAVEAGILRRNPLRKSRRRGRQAANVIEKDERPWLTPLQVLLVAERATVYAKGDLTAFMLVTALAYTGMRGRELIGLERRAIDGDRMQILWQLVERKGGLVRRPPKYGSRRTIDLPSFLVELLLAELRRHDGRCGCTDHEGGPYVMAGGPKTPHLNSVTCDNWFRAAACSRYYQKAESAYVPVPVTADHFVGEPTMGRRPATATWVPIMPGATPHSLRHSHRVWMDDDGIPEILKHERLGHEMHGIRATYSHVSPESRERLCEALTARWEQSLRQRAMLDPRSPVPFLDDLLRPYAEQSEQVSCSPNAPQTRVSPLIAKEVNRDRTRRRRAANAV